MARPEGFDRSPVAVLAVAVPLGFYAASICAGPASWDTGEMQVAPYVLGIPHPTGFPLFVLAGWLFSHVIAVSTIAWRMNFFSACAVAATAGLIYQTARAVGATRAGALFATFVFAAGKVVWDKAYLVDVHALAMLCTAGMIYALVRYLDSHDERFLYAGALASGLGLAVHPNEIWTIPAVAFAALAVSYVSGRTVLVTAVCVLGPLLFYAYEPLRSLSVAAAHLDPVQTLPWPADQRPLSVVWDTNQTRTLGGLRAQLLAAQTNPAQTLGGIFAVTRYPSYVAFWWNYAAIEFGAVALGAAAIGAIVVFARNRRAALFLLVAGFAAVPTAVVYADREADIARYFLASFVVVAICAAFLPSVGVLAPRLRILGPVLAAGLLWTAWQLEDQNRYHLLARTGAGSQDVIDLADQTVPPHSIVLTSWIDGTSLAYGQDIEHRFADRIVIVRGPNGFEPTIVTWSRIRPVYVFADWVIDGELKSMPPGWVSEARYVGLDHHLYRLCADERACARSLR